MQRRPEFSFPGSPVRRPADRLLLPRPPVPPRPRKQEEEEVRWLQASRQASPDYHYHHSSSGTPSPQLWAPHHSEHPNRQYPASAGSSPSRAQAIAGYRREMLDLVRGLPESAYELSLRDIVEHHHHHASTSSPPSSTPPPPPSSSTEPASATENAGTADEQQGRSRKQQRRPVRRQRSRSLERSVSLDTGLLIKFFMPLCVRAGKKKVSPKPDAKKKQGTNKNKEDDECCTKSELSSRTSSTGSSNSNSTGDPTAPVRSRSRKRNGCYAFFRGNKTKNGVSQD